MTGIENSYQDIINSGETGISLEGLNTTPFNHEEAKSALIDGITKYSQYQSEGSGKGIDISMASQSGEYDGKIDLTNLPDYSGFDTVQLYTNLSEDFGAYEKYNGQNDNLRLASYDGLATLKAENFWASSTGKELSPIMNGVEGVGRNIELSPNEIKDFAAMIKAEAGGEGETGRVAVAHVILNRMQFRGQDLATVLFDKNQFQPARDGRFKKTRGSLTGHDIEIAQGVLSGKYPNPIGAATFFQSVGAERQKGNRQRSAKTLAGKRQIGNHIFRTEKKHMYA